MSMKGKKQDKEELTVEPPADHAVVTEADDQIQAEEITSLHGFDYAIGAIRFGYPVRRRSHKPGLKIQGDGETGLYYTTPAKQGKFSFTPSTEDLFADDWEAAD